MAAADAEDGNPTLSAAVQEPSALENDKKERNELHHLYGLTMPVTWQDTVYTS